MNTTPAYTSNEYLEHLSQVELISDLFEGVDSAVSYLTKFPREEESVYIERQNKATLKNFVKRIALSTRNVLVNKPPQIEVASQIEPLLETFDRSKSFELFMRQVALFQVLDGFTFVVVDAPKIDDSIKTKLDQQLADIRPYAYIVRRKDVVNWKRKADGTFSRLTIRETFVKTEGRYDEEYGVQYRVYLEDGTVEVWDEGATSVKEIIQLGVNFIPVVQIGDFEVPPLYDVAKLNINHFNRRSNLDRYLTIAALPVPVIYGQQNTSGISVGVDEAILFNNKNDEGFEWKELSGSSIKSLQEDLATTEEAILQEAVILTSNDLSVAKNEAQVNNETVEGFGRLTHFAVDLENGLNTVIKYMGEFTSVSEPGFVTLDKEFKSNKLTDQEVTNIKDLYSAGIISLETALTALIEGKVLNIPDLQAEMSRLHVGG